MRFRTFFIADSLAAAISVPVWVWLAWFLGTEQTRLKQFLINFKYAVAAALLGLPSIGLIRLLMHHEQLQMPATVLTDNG